MLARVLRDEDPCLVSTVTESILPLIPDRTGSGSHAARLAQGQQVCYFLLLLLSFLKLFVQLLLICYYYKWVWIKIVRYAIHLKTTAVNA